jgi:hypothetical protein
MAKRGRKAKPVMSLIEREDDAILAYLSGVQPTLEQTAVLLWMMEGRKTPEPMSKAQIKYIETTALNKLRDGLSKVGITSLASVANFN